MTEGITLLDISVEPTKGINEVIKGSYEALKTGLENGKAQKLHAFKVLGENRFIVVACGDVDCGLTEMNEKYGDKIRVTSTPMRSYFNFAEKTLGVKKELLPTEIRDFTPGGNMYWHAAYVTYDGMTIENLIDSWHREASYALPKMKEDNIEISLFKTVLQKDVHAFIKNNPHDADNATWILPLWKEMGSKITATCKPIKLME